MPEPFPYRTRRTIKPDRMDGSRAVGEGLLREILEDAHWAPTHGLTQPWRFNVFTGAARERLSDELGKLYDLLTPAPERRPEKRAKLGAYVLVAPVVIAVAARVDPSGRITEMDEMAATSCAVQNLMLSAHQRGLGSYWSTPPVACSPEFGAWLGQDSSHRGMGLVYLGYPREGAAPVSSRVPLEERVVFHSR
jgi:nitroreductase